jgi:hypothetical protein
MNEFQLKMIEFARRLYIRINPAPFKQSFGTSGKYVNFAGQDASDIIKRRLESSEPAMICRFGLGELRAVINYELRTNKSSRFNKTINYIKGKSETFWDDKRFKPMMTELGGFFPWNEILFDRFCELMIVDISEVDILGSWLVEEKFVADKLSNVQRVRLEDLEPYLHNHPWSSVLEGKNVLLIHPFSDSIHKQFLNREKLFPGRNVLPEFNLLTIKAPFTTPGNKVEFASWFDVLENMKNQVSQSHFDIAIIGCSTYGFPLAAHVKRIGKKSVHLGGATQLLFGIKGSRWKDHPVISKMFNEYWNGPLKSEYPNNHSSLEGGCYW